MTDFDICKRKRKGRIAKIARARLQFGVNLLKYVVKLVLLAEFTSSCLQILQLSKNGTGIIHMVWSRHREPRLVVSVFFKLRHDFFE